MGSQLLFAIPLTGILAALLLLHAYWALGGRWGSACLPMQRRHRALVVLSTRSMRRWNWDVVTAK